MLRSALTAAALALSGAGALPAAASAPPPVVCEIRDPSTGECIIEIGLPPPVEPAPVDPISNPGPGGGGAAPIPTCQNAPRCRDPLHSP